MTPITQLMSFATLHKGYIMPIAHERWSKQIEHLKQTGIVKDGKIYSEYDLDKSWNDRFGKYASDHGYAYWSWKPYLIKQAMDKMQYGETLCYFDGGCVIPSDNAELEGLGRKIIDALDTIGKDGYDVGLTRYKRIPCGYIIRQEIVDKMGLTRNREFLYEFPHWQATLMLLVKTERTEKLVNDWIQFFFDNYESCIRSLYKDKTGQIEGFIHNCGDQAVFQCLLYKGQYRIKDLNDFLYSTTKRQRN